MKYKVNTVSCNLHKLKGPQHTHNNDQAKKLRNKKTLYLKSPIRFPFDLKNFQCNKFCN